MIRENLRSTSQIVETILTQPLSIPGIEKHISLLDASKNYLADPASTELEKIFETFRQHPAAFEVMLEEFKLLAQDLS